MLNRIMIVSALFSVMLACGCTATASVQPHRSEAQNANVPPVAQAPDAPAAEPDNGADHTAALDDEDSGNS